LQLGGISGKTIADTESSSTDGPVLVSGRRIRRVEQRGSEYVIHRWFEIGEVLGEYYPGGVHTVSFDQDSTNALVEAAEKVSFGTQRIELDGISDDERRQVETTLAETEQIQAQKDTAVLGTIKQHETLAQAIQPSRRGNVLLNSDISYHVYKGDNPSYEGDLTEQTGPINLVWGNGDSAGAISDDWDYLAHSSINLAGDRYIAVGRRVKKQDKDIGKNIYPEYSPNQYHARVYTISGESGIDAVGQAHKDPVDHGHLADWPWFFDESRKTFSKEWKSVSTKRSLPKDDYDTADGYFHCIKGDYRDDGGWILPGHLP